MSKKDEKLKNDRLEEKMAEEPKDVVIAEVPVILEDKPKRGRKSSRKENHDDLEKNIGVMVRTVFDVLAARDPVWKLSDEEIEAVAAPGARILARLGAEEEANKNADYIILAVGLAGIIIPRVMIIKARKQVDHETERQAGPSSPKNPGTSTGDNVRDIKRILPSLDQPAI